jgi:predicted small secreted protein
MIHRPWNLESGMIAMKTAWPALAVVAAIGLAGCGTVHGAQSGTQKRGSAQHSVHLVSSGASHHTGKSVLSAGAKRFMKMVPRGDTGYFSIGVILAPTPVGARPSAAKTAQVLNLFYKLPVAKVLLAGKLKSPEVSSSIITDYHPQFAGMKSGAKFPAIVLTYRNVPCQAYGPPTKKPRHLFKCTTKAFYDLQNSRWLGIYQF